MELDSAVTKVFGAYGVDDDPDGQDIPIDELIGSVNGWSVGIGCYGRLLVVENPAAGRRWSGVLGDGYESLETMAAALLGDIARVGHQACGQMELLCDHHP